MKIYYGGHSSFLLESKGKSVLIDPFMLSDEMKTFKPDVIALTHGHGDHIGSAENISRETSAPILGVFEIANHFAALGLNTIDGHIGGKIEFDFGWIKFVNALHSNSIDGKYTGNPCGFVINMHGTTVYHAGDTGLFGDMALIGSENIDVFLCPIGGKYTMEPDDAVKAVELVEPSIVVPMHYNTFPPIEQDPIDFKLNVEKNSPSVLVEILKPGSAFSINEEE